jgi:AAHS family benzoate transporter-like MFS transporter
VPVKNRVLSSELPVGVSPKHLSSIKGLTMDIKQTIAKSKLNRFHIGSMLMCLFVVMMEGYDLVIFGSIVSHLIEEWQLSTVTAGFIGSAALAGMMIGSFSLGILADKIGRKQVTILCLTTFSVFTGISGFIHSAWLFAGCRFLAGLGIGGAMPNAIGLLSDYVPAKRRNIMVAITTTGMQIGGILAPVISIAAVPTLGWRFCLYIAFIALIAVPVMIRLLPNSLDNLYVRGKMEEIKRILKKVSPETDSAEIQWTLGASNTEKSPVVELFRNNRALNTIMFWVAFFMGLLMIYGLNTWLPKLMETAGYSLGSSLVFLIVLNSVGLVGTVVLGQVADRMKNSRALLIGLYLVGAVVMALIALVGNVTAAYILIGICGICTFGSQNIGIAFVSHYYPGKIRTTGLGVCNTVGRVGGILGPTFGGILLAAQLPMFYNCLAFAIPGVLASIAYVVVRHDRGGEKLPDIATVESEALYH